MTEPMTVLEDQLIATLVPEVFTLVHQDIFPSLFVDLMFNKNNSNS